MDQKIDNRLKGGNVERDYVGGNQTKNYYISMFQDSDREFVVTHNADIKPTAYFIGRETELEDLRQRIEEGHKSVLVSGMGGIGKTQICRKLFEEYSKNEKGAFSHIGYIEYDVDMDSSLQRCLKFKQQDSPEQNSEAAWRELEYLASDGKLLLFIDNVNASIGSDFGLERLKRIPGAIVLTSRRTSFSTEFEPYRIGFLNTGQLRKIYEKIKFEDSGKRLNEEDIPILDYIIDKLAARHTITVEFLAHLAQTKHWTMQKLRDELEKKGFCLEYMDGEDKLVNIQKSYETLYDLSVLTEAEQNILEAFSVFPYIPLSVQTCNDWLLADARACLKNHSRNLHFPLGGEFISNLVNIACYVFKIGDKFSANREAHLTESIFQTRYSANENDDILMGLHRKGWLQFDIEQESYALHPVFAQFIFEKCKPKLERHSGLIHSFEESLKIPESGSPLVCQQYLPFAEKTMKKLDAGEDVNQITFIDSIAYLLQYISEYRKAEELCEKSLRIRERVLGEWHPETAAGYNNLAFLYGKQGEYSKAEELYEKSLRIKERVLGEGHPSTATSYNNLAGIYENQGEYSKAEELYKKSLRICERVLGEEHPDTAESYNNLAGIYENQGEYKKAEELYKKSLRIRERVLGEWHPETAASYNNLAFLYGKQEEYSKAEELYEKSLRIKERFLGEDHPDTAIGYNNLAGLYRHWGEYDTALIYYLKSYKVFAFRLGIKHPNTQIVNENMKMAFCEWNADGGFEQWLEENMEK